MSSREQLNQSSQNNANMKRQNIFGNKVKYNQIKEFLKGSFILNFAGHEFSNKYD